MRTKLARWVLIPGVATSLLLVAAGLASGSTGHRAARHFAKREHRAARLVSWEFTTTFTFAAPGQPFPPGSTTLERIVYDPRRVDSAGDVVITGHQHFIGGVWANPRGPAATPVSNLSVFNVKTKTLTYDVQVTHGVPIVLVYTPFKFTGVYSQTDGSELEGGTYAFNASGPRPCNAHTWFDNGTC